MVRGSVLVAFLLLGAAAASLVDDDCNHTSKDEKLGALAVEESAGPTLDGDFERLGEAPDTEHLRMRRRKGGGGSSDSGSSSSSGGGGGRGGGRGGGGGGHESSGGGGGGRRGGGRGGSSSSFDWSSSSSDSGSSSSSSDSGGGGGGWGLFGRRRCGPLRRLLGVCSDYDTSSSYYGQQQQQQQCSSSQFVDYHMGRARYYCYCCSYAYGRWNCAYNYQYDVCVVQYMG